MAEDDVLPPDVRDEALGRALEVAPLDELTRHRLVRGALAAADDGREEVEAPTKGTARARVLGIAAAAVAFVVLGVAALALPGGDTTDVASRAPQARSQEASPTPTTSAPDSSRAAAPSAAAAGGGTSTGIASDSTAFAGAPAPIDGVPTLGDLGELSTPGTRARVLVAAEPVVGDRQPIPRLVSYQGCPARGLRAVAAGLGTLDGAPALVVVSRRDDGSLRARVLDSSTCKLRSLP